MDPQTVFCHNSTCPASGQVGKGNIGVHSHKERRYKCHVCGKTFSETKGTVFYRLRTDPVTVMLVITLLAHGCPLQAIVVAFSFDERTVKDWWRRAGEHCRAVHEQVVGQSELDLEQVQADEIKVKTQAGTLWLAMAMMVSTRLWLGAVVSKHRDLNLISALVARVRAVALCRPLLIAVDGLASYVTAFQQACRSPLPRYGLMRQEELEHGFLARRQQYGDFVLRQGLTVEATDAAHTPRLGEALETSRSVIFRRTAGAGVHILEPRVARNGGPVDGLRAQAEHSLL